MILGIKKNVQKARWLIFGFSAIVFILVSFLGRYKLDVQLPFDEHLFAKANAIINSIVAVLLLAGFLAAYKGNYTAHRNIMLTAMVLSVLFLLSYVCHHLFSGEAKFGDLNHDGVLSAEEKLKAGSLRIFYLVFLSIHIVLAGIVLPFILFTAYRALINENAKHRRLAKITWPMWFFVAVSGPAIYLMISPYY
jgi:putative membrane protein